MTWHLRSCLIKSLTQYSVLVIFVSENAKKIPKTILFLELCFEKYVLTLSMVYYLYYKNTGHKLKDSFAKM